MSCLCPDSCLLPTSSVSRFQAPPKTEIPTIWFSLLLPFHLYPPLGSGLHFLSLLYCCCVISKTPQTLAKAQQQNCPMREAVDLISFPLNGPKSLPVIRGKTSHTQDRVLWCRRWERESIKKVPEILGLRDQIRKATPLIQNQMNVSGMFVKQTCHYLSQFEEVSASSHTWDCNRVIYSCQSTVLTNAGPRFDVINSFIYNDGMAINSLVRGV